jgi:fructose-specific phosphotransferase system component IIB
VTRKIFQAVAILFLSAGALMAASVQRWIHVRVETAGGVGANVSINVPIEMAEAVLPTIPSDQPHHGKFSLQASVNGMDLRAMLEAAGKAPDNVFVTYERNGKEVSVAKSHGNLLIKIVEKPSAEEHLGKSIAVKVPIPVVRAMLVKDSEQLDVGAGIRALVREGDVDVTVNSAKENVRVWTDTNTTPD